MRVPLTIVVVLLLLFGIGLGLTVMWGGVTGGRAGGEDATVGHAGGSQAQANEMPLFRGGKPQGHVYTGAAGEPSDVNPFTTYDPLGRGLVLAYTHDTLLDQDPDTGLLRPALAESYELSADETNCTFTLREGVVFSNGAPLTMEDVLFGWELAQAGHLTMGFAGQGLKRITAVESLDGRRFRVHFKERYFASVDAVGLSWVVANKQFFLERVRSSLDPGESMPAVATPRFAVLLKQIKEECGPGTGPYVLLNDPHGVSNWRRRQELLLTRHEGCWRRSLRPGSWNFAGMRVLFRDPAGARNALLRGEVDWFSGAQLDALLAAQPALNDNFHRYDYDTPKLGCYRMVWNCKVKPFDDVRVRRAMAMLLNRAEVEKVFLGTANTATAHAKLGSRAYPELEPLPFDPAAARKLLREAGFDAEQGTPLHLTLLTYHGHEPTRRLVELFTNAAKSAGVQVEVHARESAGVVAEKSLKQWHGFLALQFFEPWCDPYRFLHSEGLENEGGWQHPDADRLADAARHEFDADKRAGLWRQLHELAHREQPATLIVHPLASMLFNQHIEDCVPGPLGLKPDRAWVAPEYQRH